MLSSGSSSKGGLSGICVHTPQKEWLFITSAHSCKWQCLSMVAAAASAVLFQTIQVRRQEDPSMAHTVFDAKGTAYNEKQARCFVCSLRGRNFEADDAARRVSHKDAHVRVHLRDTRQSTGLFFSAGSQQHQIVPIYPSPNPGVMVLFQKCIPRLTTTPSTRI